MFKGNAKTHFQTLGRSSSNSLGFMMSPFGDDRWDADDREKLKKIFKKSDLDGFVRVNENAAQKYSRSRAQANPDPSEPANPQTPNEAAINPQTEELQQPTLDLNQQNYYKMPYQQIQQPIPQPPQVPSPGKDAPGYAAVEAKPRTMLTQPSVQNPTGLNICKECQDKLSSGACKFGYSAPKETVSEASVPVAGRVQFAPPGTPGPNWILASGEKSVYAP